MAEIGYYYGFLDIYWDRNEDNRSLFTTDDVGLTPTFFNNSVNQSQIQFKLSILF